MDQGFFETPGAYPGYDMSALEVDNAYLTVDNRADTRVFLYSLNHDCRGCPYEPIEPYPSIMNGSSEQYSVYTAHPWSFLILDTEHFHIRPDKLPNSSFQCMIPDQLFGEFGVYLLRINNGNSCELHTKYQPVFIYGGMIIAAAVYAVLLLLLLTMPTIVRKLSSTGLASCCRHSDSQTDLAMSNRGKPDEPVKPPKPRVRSLDTFRGLSIALMIFVNYGAGGYWWLEHATWDGLQIADLVFPWFLWIMGVCIPIGLRSAERRKVPKWRTMTRILKRSVKLFILGIILNSLGGWNDLSKYRIPGVLQRFAICYLVVALVALFMPEPKQRESNIGRMLSDVFNLTGQWIFHLILVIVHAAIMFGLPVPGCPTGYIGPGGVALMKYGAPSPDCIGGATGYIDKLILGEQHLYQNPTAKTIYSSGAFDPEGILGSLLAIFQVFLGLVAGNILHFHKSHKSRMVRWLIWSAICGLFGMVLCLAGTEGAPIPLNKNLWSLSFVLVTSCFAFFLLALCYLIVDKFQIWDGTPLYQAGMNSILLYVGHSVTYNLFPWHYVVGSMNTHAALLTECLWGTTLWVATALYLHHKGKFYTV